MTHRPSSQPCFSRLRARPSWFAVLFLVAGCSREHSKDVTFGGALLPSRARVAALDGSSDFAASLPEQARVVAVVGNVLERLLLPAECSSPLAVETGDVNGDALTDILVLDASCGGWLALASSDGAWQIERWERFLPVIPAAHYLLFDDLDGDGDTDLAAASPTSISGFTRNDQQGWEPFDFSLPYPNVNQLLARNIGLVVNFQGETVLALQQPAQLTLVRPSRPNASVSVLPQRRLELLKAYEGYDQLSPLPPIEGCSTFALGAGFFAASLRAPKPLVRLRFTPDGFEANRIDTKGEQTIALALVGLQQREFVGVLEGSKDGFWLEVLERSDCDHFESRFARKVSFEVPGIVPVPDTPEELAASSGESFLASVVSGNLRFAHFDGARLHEFEVDPRTWMMHETIRTF
jgi:hypothetical protein